MTSIANNYLTAPTVASRIRKGELSVSQVVEDHIGRWSERDKEIKAWVHFDPERARAEAQRLDEIPVDQRGPLHGILIGVKDMMRGSSPTRLV